MEGEKAGSLEMMKSVLAINSTSSLEGTHPHSSQTHAPETISTAIRLVPAAVLAPRRYALLVSGTFNPPHCGHIRIAMRAAAALEADSHSVTSIWFVPVHDNYLHNKVTASGDKTVIFSMEVRVALLRSLIQTEVRAWLSQPNPSHWTQPPVPISCAGRLLVSRVPAFLYSSLLVSCR